MKRAIKSILCMVLLSVFLMVVVSAADVITPMGSCYFEVSDVSCTCTEKWYGTVLASREFSPSTKEFTLTKHGEVHEGDLSISAPYIVRFSEEYEREGYTIRVYEAKATYSGYLSCSGDISEMKLD